MLKSIYTETGLQLVELLDANITGWIAQRHSFAASTGETYSCRVGKATMQLPSDQIATVTDDLVRAGANNVTVCHCDVDLMEIEFTSGYWLGVDADLNHRDFIKGIFVTKLLPSVEVYLWRLWYATNQWLVAGDEVRG